MRTTRTAVALLGAVALMACGKEPARDDAAAPVATAGSSGPEATPVAYAGPRVAATIDVWKSPTCGCCNAWIAQLEDAGFTVVKHDVKDVEAVKDSLGVPKKLVSCHTAKVNGYLVEGHVPIEMIARLVTDQPKDISGIGVNGMPLGSPGMEGYGRKDPFDVEAWDATGTTRVFARVNGS